MIIIHSVLCALYCALFIIAATNLGIISFLLAFIYDPRNVKQQVYFLVDSHPMVLSTMSVVPGWVLIESYWLTFAISLVMLVDVPLLLLILWRHRRPITPIQNQTNSPSALATKTVVPAWIHINLSFFLSLTLAFFTAINTIIGATALAWLIRQNRGTYDPHSRYQKFDLNAPTEGPYSRYTSSEGFTIGAFSCALADTAVGRQRVNLHHICQIGKVPSKLLIAYVVLSSVVLLLMAVSWACGPRLNDNSVRNDVSSRDGDSCIKPTSHPMASDQVQGALTEVEKAEMA